jgi:cation diffusion facilitator CzcD-associated flavoprotein CzcO
VTERAHGPDHRIAIIGAGFAGLGMAVRLAQEGERDFVVLERADRVGGVWRENTYPGAACDVPSHLYSYSWDRPSWSRRYSPQPEILAYLESQVRTHDLAGHLRFRAGVLSLVWDEDRWVVELEDETTLTASVVVSAVGQLGRPSLPDIAGIETFAGRSWHTARWDHGVDLAGARFGIIGTGATAIQVVPEVAKVAATVTVFQRSAPYVLPKVDYPYDSPRGRPFRLPGLSRLDRGRIFLTGETLTSAYVRSEKMAELVTARWRRHLEDQVADPGLREKATPDYRVGCKRIGFSSDWYPALASEHVELVTDPIEEVTPAGVRTADGTERQLDVLVYGTGFSATGFLQPMRITGRHGQDLHERWGPTGAQAYGGVAVSGYPNFFMLYGPNSNLGANSIIYMLESQIAYVLQAFTTLRREELAWMDVRPEVEAADNRWLDDASARTTYRSGCHSWYVNEAGRNVNNWPTFTFLYRRKLRRLELLDYDVAPAGVAVPVPVAS